MFCAIATTIEHCKTEGVVDVFQVVKALRIHKPGAVLNVVSQQYRLGNSQHRIIFVVELEAKYFVLAMEKN